MNLQLELDGRELQLLLAFLHAVWRCRCVMLKGYAFTDYDDMATHVCSLVEDPWLHGCPCILSRCERRELRSLAPDLPSNTLVYFFDGGSRLGDQGRNASYGALLRIDGVVVARNAVYAGDRTNNEAEYLGVLAVLRRAVRQVRETTCNRVWIYGDSKLVISQLSGVWKCKADNLAPFYEEGLHAVRHLHTACIDGSFRMTHIYREYNVDADALANIALDQYRPGQPFVLVDYNWSQCSALHLLSILISVMDLSICLLECSACSPYLLPHCCFLDSCLDAIM